MTVNLVFQNNTKSAGSPHTLYEKHIEIEYKFIKSTEYTTGAV